MKYDVCIPTYNSAETLASCLEAIVRSVPISRIIVADGYSSDNTIKIVNDYGCELHYCRGRLGQARNVLMDMVKSDLFFFIDSDVVVNPQWFHTLDASFDGSTGAINGFALPNAPALSNLRRSMLLAKLCLKMVQRGFTSNTLIRKAAVADIKLSNINRCEDILLQELVLRKGLKWKFAPAFCVHLKESKRIFKEAAQDFLTIARSRGMLSAAFCL